MAPLLLAPVWVPIPSGVDGSGRLRLTVFLSFRLQGDAPGLTLGDFPDLLDWPATIRGDAATGVAPLKLEVAFEPYSGSSGTVTVPANGAPGSRTPDSSLWRALFRQSTPVTSYQAPTLHRTTLNSYQSGYVNDQVRQSTTSGSGTSARGRRPGPLPAIVTRPGTTRPSAQPAQAQSAPVREFARFFDRPRLPDRPPPKVPALDFHADLGLLGEHPEVMRRLGLVFDLLVDPGALTDRNTSSTGVRLRPHWSSAFDQLPARQARTVNVVPAVVATLQGGRFSPLPRDARSDRQAGGWLSFDDTKRYSVNVVDDTHAMLQHLVLNGVDVASDPLSGADETQARAALRSGGLSVAQPFRAFQERARLSRQADVAAYLAAAAADGTGIPSNPNPPDPDSVVRRAPGPENLFADDLVRGFRVDVRRDGDASWRSLCQRNVGYKLVGVEGVPAFASPPGEEGAVSLALVGNLDHPDDGYYLADALFHWTGWSLCTPRPGMALTTPTGQAGDPGFGYVSGSDSVRPELPLAATTRATPGSLPVLRFGVPYRVRARVVDVAGGGIPISAADDTHASAVTPYLRFDPVPPPVVALRHRLGQAEALERLVIRSNYQGAPDDAPTTTVRLLVPPKTPQILAETHGMFDGDDGRARPDAYGLASREKGTLKELSSAPPNAEGVVTDPIIERDTFIVPYLPDVISRGVALAGLPTASDWLDVATVPFEVDEGGWPNLRPVRLVLTAGSGRPDLAAGTVTVHLERAAVVEAEVSSFLHPGDVDLMGVWSWLAAHEASSKRPTVRRLAELGRVPTISPRRTLTLVHAVRQPLLRPKPGDTPERGGLGVERKEGATYAGLVGAVTIDGSSTAHLDILARWTDYYDVPAEDRPRTAAANAVAARLSVAKEEVNGTSYAIDRPRTEEADCSDVWHFNRKTKKLERVEDCGLPRVTINTPVRHELGDTKRRTITYDLVATSRFGEYFDRNGTFTLGPAPVSVDPLGFAPGSVVVRPEGSDTAPPYSDGAFVTDAAAGTVARVPGGAIADGARVRIEWRPPITRSTLVDDDRTGPASRTLTVPSSARPAPPRPLYAVPTFAWSPRPTPGSSPVTSTRGGGGLRVFLERPWYASGEGELLGVVLAPAAGPGGNVDFPNLPPLSENARHTYTTTWGADPVWITTGPPSTGVSTPKDAPRVENFSTHAGVVRNLLLAETPAVVDVVGYPVEFDEERKLWFADIVLDPGKSYFPFVRLALCRYQPASVAGVELSPVRALEFLQLAPDRTATVVRRSATTVHVTVNGVSYVSACDPRDPSRTVSGPARMLVDVEVLRRGDPADDLSWEPPNANASPTELPGRLLPAGRGLAVLLGLGRDGTARWEGDVEIPEGIDRGRHRLVIREFDVHGRIAYLDVIELSLQRG